MMNENESKSVACKLCGSEVAAGDELCAKCSNSTVSHKQPWDEILAATGMSDEDAKVAIESTLVTCVALAPNPRAGMFVLLECIMLLGVSHGVPLGKLAEYLAGVNDEQAPAARLAATSIMARVFAEARKLTREVDDDINATKKEV